MKLGTSVAVESRGGVDVVVLRSQGAIAEIVPAWGGGCIRFDALGAPVVEAVPFEVVARKPASYGIPLLFPFPNRIRDGRFRFAGREFTVDPSRHGFVRDKPWNVIGRGSSGGEGAWVRSRLLAADFPHEILAQFPFSFRIDVTWRLTDSALRLEVEIENRADEPMPWGFGIHPYFVKPAGCVVVVPAASRFELEESLPTGRLLAVEGPFDLRQGAAISAFAFDDIFTDLTANAGGRVECRIDDPSSRRSIAVAFDPASFPDVVVYTPPLPRAAIAIEPLTCPTDAFNLVDRGLLERQIVLAPGASTSLATQVSVTTE